VSGVDPLAGPTAGGATETITGSGFVPGARVSFGGVAATGVLVSSDGELTADLPAHAAGAVAVRVSTPGGTSATSSADRFVYGQPHVSRVNPSAGPDAGGATVTILGSGFVPGATVDFGATAATGVTVAAAGRITATAPAGARGSVDVTVTTPAGTSATTPADLYAYGSPDVTSVSPANGPIGGGNTVTITGDGFAPGARVKFGTHPATGVTVTSATTLTAVAPAGAAGTVDVTVATAAGTSPVAPADGYAYGTGSPTE
jgi:hypothetical protein